MYATVTCSLELLPMQCFFTFGSLQVCNGAELYEHRLKINHLSGWFAERERIRYASDL